jgi:hypothetical protein
MSLQNQEIRFLQHEYAITPLRHYAITPVPPLRHYAITPLCHYASTPICQYDHYAIMPLRHYTITPVHHYAITPVRPLCQYAITPLRQYGHYASTPLRQYTVTPLRQYGHYASMPLCQYGHYAITPICHYGFPLTNCHSPHSLASVKDMYVEMGFPLNLYQHSLSKLYSKHLTDTRSTQEKCAYQPMIFGLKVFKRGLSKTLGEHIPKLLRSLNLQKFDSTLDNFLTKPDSLGCVILTTQREFWWQSFSQHQCTRIVLMNQNSHVHISSWYPNSNS